MSAVMVIREQPAPPPPQPIKKVIVELTQEQAEQLFALLGYTTGSAVRALIDANEETRPGLLPQSGMSHALGGFSDELTELWRAMNQAGVGLPEGCRA